MASLDTVIDLIHLLSPSVDETNSLSVLSVISNRFHQLGCAMCSLYSSSLYRKLALGSYMYAPLHDVQC